MSTSNSHGNQLGRISLAIKGARSYLSLLPKEAEGCTDRLELKFTLIQDLNAQQEKAKQQVVMTTNRLKTAMKEGREERARLVRLAEATFGPRDPRLKEFRPSTEGKVRTSSPRTVKGKAKVDAKADAASK